MSETIENNDNKKKGKTIYDHTYKPYEDVKPFTEKDLNNLMYSCNNIYTAGMAMRNTHSFFWNVLSRSNIKYCFDIPTAAVGFDNKQFQLNLYINPYFLGTLERDRIEFVLYHEILHVVKGHLNGSRKTPHEVANIAMDLGINATLVQCGMKPPDMVLIPGVNNYEKNKNNPKYIAMNEKVSDDDLKFQKKFNEFIEQLPADKNEDFYFYAILKFLEKEGKGGQQSLKDMLERLKKFGLSDADSHEEWELEDNDAMGEVFRDYIKNLINNESSKQSWSNLPKNFRDELMELYFDHKINGRALIRYFVGSKIKSHHTSSFSRVNRRFPYLHPGKKRDTYAKIAVFVDQSGSMDNDSISLIYSVLAEINRNVEFDIIPFDTEVDVDNIFVLSKNSKKEYKVRTKGGGTSFQCCVDYILESKKYEGYIICTDGFCSKPDETKIKRMWILLPETKLGFETDDIVINIKDL
jgi:predicted metal-dependent peptidase